MTETTAGILAGAIKDLGNSETAKDVVLFIYRLGYLDGQTSMTKRAQELLNKEFPEALHVAH